MKKKVVYILDIIFISITIFLAIRENLVNETGLKALEGAGKFCLFSILAIVGVVFLIIFFISDYLIRKRKNNK